VLREHDLMSAGPDAMVRHLATREAWMRDTVGTLRTRDLTVPSVLPGWSRAHVLVHMARNADSHRRRIEAAARGEMVDQYVGGAAGRVRDSEEGATRDSETVVDDVIASSHALDRAWQTVEPAHWDVKSRDLKGTVRALGSLPRGRLAEIEVHVVDLGVGPTQRDWSQPFVDRFLPSLRATVASRLPAGVDPPKLALDERDELWWLFGRGKFPGLPQLTPL
jgi:maleylpyruvate isomerase